MICFISSTPLCLTRRPEIGWAPDRPRRQHLCVHHDQNVQYACRIAHIMCSSLPTTSDKGFETLAYEIQTYLSLDTTPDEGPLSFDALKRAGQTDIMNGIIKFGGSSTVAERMGLNISLFVPPLELAQSKAFPDFIKPETETSIAIGTNLNARLDSIANIDTTKPAVESTQSQRTLRKQQQQQRDNVPSAEELIEQNKAIVPPIVDDIIPEGETLALSPVMRLAVVAAFIFIAFGYGKASNQVFEPQAIELFKGVGNGLIILNSIFAVYGSVAARNKGRDPIIWFVKTLLAGIFALKSLQSLEPLDDDVNDYRSDP